MSNFEQMLSEGSKISSKRVVTLIATGLFTLSILVEMFTPLSISKDSSSNLLYLICFGIGAVASERFTKNNKNESKN